MSVIKSKLKTSSTEFKAAAESMRAQVEELNARLARAREGGDAAARARHEGRGKLLPRDRVAALLGISDGYVRVLLHRAREHVRACPYP
jgi:3-methylcrotonyl-CoA carboxylase beta subunit